MHKHIYSKSTGLYIKWLYIAYMQGINIVFLLVMHR